jgi:hypothetical protein
MLKLSPLEKEFIKNLNRFEFEFTNSKPLFMKNPLSLVDYYLDSNKPFYKFKICCKYGNELILDWIYNEYKSIIQPELLLSHNCQEIRFDYISNNININVAEWFLNLPKTDYIYYVDWIEKIIQRGNYNLFIHIYSKYMDATIKAGDFRPILDYFFETSLTKFLNNSLEYTRHNNEFDYIPVYFEFLGNPRDPESGYNKYFEISLFLIDEIKKLNLEYWNKNTKRFFINAITYNNLEMSKHIYENYDISDALVKNEELFRAACMANNKEMAKFIFSLAPLNLNMRYLIDIFTLNRRGDRLTETEKNYVVGTYNSSEIETYMYLMFYMMCKMNKLEMVKIIYELGHIKLDRHLIKNLSMYCSVWIMEWLIETKDNEGYISMYEKLECGTNAFEIACYFNNLEVAKKIYEMTRCEINNSFVLETARFQNCDISEYKKYQIWNWLISLDEYKSKYDLLKERGFFKKGI